MSEQPISRFPVPELSSLPADMRERIESVQEKAGFVPNVFVALAHRPDEFRAFFAYYDALMEREESSLTKAEREMIVVATSGANECHYCVVSHGALLRIYSKEPLLSDPVAINWRKAPVSAKQKVMLAFAVKIAVAAQEIDDTDHQAMLDAGFDQDAIWDVGSIAAFFALSNRLAHLSDMQPNAEFYTMGREPR
ncbi:MAG: peroxidase-related enzyme [Gammaproteobacteria bacterium]|nr:peroxidase-related enzyme [Gammaproteobacteria bacterium]